MVLFWLQDISEHKMFIELESGDGIRIMRDLSTYGIYLNLEYKKRAPGLESPKGSLLPK